MCPKENAKKETILSAIPLQNATHMVHVGFCVGYVNSVKNTSLLAGQYSFINGRISWFDSMLDVRLHARLSVSASVSLSDLESVQNDTKSKDTEVIQSDLKPHPQQNRKYIN